MGLRSEVGLYLFVTLLFQRKGLVCLLYFFPSPLYGKIHSLILVESHDRDPNNLAAFYIQTVTDFVLTQ